MEADGVSRVEVRPLGPGRFAAAVTEGTTTTHHKVAVRAGLLADRDLDGTDPAQVVHEAVAFFLDRQPVTALPEEFPLDELAEHFEDFWPEVRARVS